MLSPIDDLDRFRTTRTSWHTLAERVLAPARHAATGRIGLRPTPAGIGTPPFSEGRTLAIEGAELVVNAGDVTTRSPITTLRAAAEAAGIDPGSETGLYTPSTPDDPDARLVVDPDMAAVLRDWFALGNRVLLAWSAAHPDDRPSEIQLWPEHFDLALDLGPDSGRANYGASPGDGDHESPYLYVGPWTPNDNEFWNAGTYARLGYEELRADTHPAQLAAHFFAEGYAAANS